MYVAWLCLAKSIQKTYLRKKEYESFIDCGVCKDTKTNSETWKLISRIYSEINHFNFNERRERSQDKKTQNSMWPLDIGCSHAIFLSDPRTL